MTVAATRVRDRDHMSEIFELRRVLAPVATASSAPFWTMFSKVHRSGQRAASIPPMKPTGRANVPLPFRPTACARPCRGAGGRYGEKPDRRDEHDGDNGAEPGSAGIARRCGIDGHAARCWNGGRRRSCFFCSILNDHGAQETVTIRTTSYYQQRDCAAFMGRCLRFAIAHRASRAPRRYMNIFLVQCPRFHPSLQVFRLSCMFYAKGSTPVGSCSLYYICN